MTAERLLNPSKLPLGVCDAHDATPSQALVAVVLVVRDVECIRRSLLEALQATKGHVLNGEQRAVVKQNEVEIAVHDDSAVECVNGTRQDDPR